jgi:uncharacterized protein
MSIMRSRATKNARPRQPAAAKCVPAGKMSHKEKLQEDLKVAMKARDELRVSTIRLALSAVRNTEIDKGRDLTDDETLEVVAREVKRRREAIEGAEKAERPDIVERESAELKVLAVYLPEQLSEEDITRFAAEVIVETGASGPKDRGKVMSALMQKVRGRADGKVVSQVVERILQG